MCRPSEYILVVCTDLALIFSRLYLYSFMNEHIMVYSLCLDTGDVNSTVQNLTVLSVNPTSITVRWSVSSQYNNISGRLSYCGYHSLFSDTPFHLVHTILDFSCNIPTVMATHKQHLPIRMALPVSLSTH